MVKTAPILIEFGDGDIGLNVGKFDDGLWGVALINGEPVEIGVDRFEEFKDLPPSGYVRFKNVESLDAVINCLQRVRSYMQEEKSNDS
jgi:hypothetical protein